MNGSGVLPIVDLGYVRQQATEYNKSSSIYTFSNIRYAQAPEGDLRWAPPLSPKPEQTLQRGEKDRICFQAQPAWQMSQLGPWIEAWLSNDTASFYEQFPLQPDPPPVPANLSDFFPPLLPEETEDCLFLDVHVPKEVFDQRAKRQSDGAAIFLWIHGGGLMLGNKKADSNFRGLITRSREDGQQAVIVISINYRLGAFGFLGGPSFQSSSGVSNLGLLDQRLAFEWVRTNAHLFGGNADRVTVVGESAGGASIVHHITAHGGIGEAPAFQQAIIQSGGWNPSTRNSSHLEMMYHRFLEVLQVDSLQDARQLPAMDIRNANFLLTYILRWGELGFGVEPDGDYVPDGPAKLLLEGRFHRNISIMVGQNAAEGVLCTSPWIFDEASTRAFISDTLPTASEAQIDYITDELYPLPLPAAAAAAGKLLALSNGNSSEENAYLARATFLVSEAGVWCNSGFLARGLLMQQNSNDSNDSSKPETKMYNYFFRIPPALHTDDLAYTLYDDSDPDSVASVVDGRIAAQFQEYLLNFVRRGNPNGKMDGDGGIAIMWDDYGDGGANWTLDINESGFGRTENPAANNDRCRWWQENFYD